MLGFRVWDVENKKMVDMVDDDETDLYLNELGELIYISLNGREQTTAKLYIPMQSTGLNDSTGKEIFDKDILQSISNDKILHVNDFHFFIRQHVNNIIYMMADKDRTPMSYMREYINNLSLPCVIIGNSMQNPELLEKIK